MDIDELAEELSELAPPEKKGSRSPHEERIIAGFEEIQRYCEQYGHAPRHGEDKDIFERLYAVRLERLRSLKECRALLAPLDHQGLLSGAATALPQQLDEDALAAELAGLDETASITELRHVRSHAEIQAAEEIAARDRCEDFEQFKPLFEQFRNDLKSGVRQAIRFGGKEIAGDDKSFGARKDLIENKNASIKAGDVFILSGQMVYIAEVGELSRTPNRDADGRMRVIYDNGTQSNLLLRSLQRALYKDETGRRVILPDLDLGPLFLEAREEGDLESGTIYVLRSLSDLPYVAEHRELIHKIGVTGGKVETRIANAAHEATYLLADVEVVATFSLVGIQRTKLEKLVHRIFSPAQLDLVIHDRFGTPVQPKEWFLVPFYAIEEAIHHIRDGSITGLVYDPKTASFQKAAAE